MKGLSIALLLSLLPLPTLAGTTRKEKNMVLEVRFTFKQEGSTGKYAFPLQQTFELKGDGSLRYTAYYFNMPIDMNHMDGVEGWKSGAAGDAVLKTAERLFPKLWVMPEDPSSIPDHGVFIVQLGGQGSRFVADRASTAWKELNAAFETMVAAFEKATGRPVSPSDLPQK